MKKLLALVLALAMVLGTFTFVAAAPEDVVGTEYEESVARLVALGIINGFEDGTYRPGEPVTRAQFAKIVVSALGVGEAAQYATGSGKFADVPADHWATGYINVAVDVGVINGYPDGTFQPENQVTFAEAIKMIVAALGYTPKAEALGGYPGGYLAVAAEEEITDGVNVVGGLSADRGAVAMMVDNSLEVYLMEQKSYGDNPTWEASDTRTLLNTKLGVKEEEGFVTGISRTEKLSENEFVLDSKDKYEMVIDVNTESLFLKEVKVLYKEKGKDKKVVWVGVETAEKDIVFDTVAEFVKGDDDEKDKIALKVADKKYDLDADANLWVNFDEATPEEGDYGYFIFDGKEIIAANLFKFDEEGLVTGLAKDEIEYRGLGDAEEQVLELDDFDEVYVYNGDFTKADPKDIDEGSLIFFWEEDDELFVIAVNNKAEGEVSRLRDDRVTVDGKNYVIAEGAAIVSSNKGKDFEVLEDVTDYDVMDEDVVLYLDLNGKIAAMVTSAKVTTDELYGLVTWFYEGRNPSVAVFTSEGKEVEYEFERRADADEFYTGDNLLAGLNDNETVFAIKYELNSDGDIAKGSLELLKDDDKVTKAANRKYLVGDDDYFIASGTVIMKALDSKGELDPKVMNYESLIDMAITKKYGAGNNEGASVLLFGEAGKNAKMIVFLDKNFEGSKDDVYFGVVTDEPWKVGKNWFAEMDIFGEGKGEYKAENVEKGDLVAFTLDGSDKVDAYDADEAGVFKVVSGVVYKRSGSYIELDDGEIYRVASGAVLYKLNDKGKLDGTVRLTRIHADEEEGDTIEFLYDEKEKEVVAGIVNVELDL